MYALGFLFDGKCLENSRGVLYRQLPPTRQQLKESAVFAFISLHLELGVAVIFKCLISHI